MRYIVLLTSLCLCLPLVAQINVSISLDKKEYLSFEALHLNVRLGNKTGNPLLLKNSPSHSWIEFIIQNQNGRVVNKISEERFNSINIPVAQAVTPKFILNNIFEITEPGNYSVSVIVRTSNQTRSQGTLSSKSYFSINRGVPQWKTQVGVPGLPGEEREYRIIKHNSNGTPSIYVQVEDTKRGHILATYAMGRILAHGKPSKTTDKMNNLHVLFHTTPELYSHTVVNTSGKTIKRTYYQSFNRYHPYLVNNQDGSIQVVNGSVYDPNRKVEEKAQFHNLSEMPPGL